MNVSYFFSGGRGGTVNAKPTGRTLFLRDSDAEKYARLILGFHGLGLELGL